MSYADQKMSSGRITAIVIVALLHALLGYAFVTGLAYNVVKQVAKDLKTFDVIEEPPPPEEEPPPPPPDTPQPATPPPVVAPPPIVRVNTPAPVIRTVRTAPPAPITYTAPPAPPAPPAPRPQPSQAAGAELRSGSITNDDYPSSALRSGDEGTTTARFTIGTNGRVSNCTVTSSSGNSALDSATCRLIESRFRYRPAKDRAGNPTTETKTQRIVWQIPD